MNRKKLISEVKRIYGKDRSVIKSCLISFIFEGKEYRKWNKRFKSVTDTPFEISFKLFDDVIEALIEEDYGEIDWNWIGDVSWEIDILLNKAVQKGYDWDKKLARKCNGTARLFKIWINDIIPAYTTDTYYMTYDSKERYYEFGPLNELNDYENYTVAEIKQLLKKLDYYYVSQALSSKKYKELVSDCNSEGGATIFDCLFSDTCSYQKDIKRFNEKPLKDPTGKKISWNEYYDLQGTLLYREEYRYYKSGNVECVVTDEENRIVKVKVWRDIGEYLHKEFILDIKKKYKRMRKYEESKQQ